VATTGAIQTSKVITGAEITFACELYKQAMKEKESAEQKIQAAKDVMKTHLGEEGLRKDSHQGLNFMLIDVGITTTYDKKTLELLVPAEILEKAKKESLRDEYIRVTGLEKKGE